MQTIFNANGVCSEEKQNKNDSSPASPAVPYAKGYMYNPIFCSWGIFFLNVVPSHPFPLLHLLKPGIVGTVDHVIRKIDQKLGQAAFRGSIITKDRGKGSVSQRLRQALAESLSGTSVVTQPRNEFSPRKLLNPMDRLNYRRKHRTTCFRSRTVCCSTS